MGVHKAVQRCVKSRSVAIGVVPSSHRVARRINVGIISAQRENRLDGVFPQLWQHIGSGYGAKVRHR